MNKNTTQNNSIFLSVVIPAYNEIKNLERGVLSSVYDYLVSQKYSWEVIVVDDGSSDKTANVVEAFVSRHHGFRLIKGVHRGKGGSVIAGMMESKGDYVLFSDMDQSTPINQIEKLLPKVRSGYDIAIGSRSGRPGQTYIRKLMSYGLSVVRYIILQLPYKDTQCGFKIFKNSAAKDVFGKMLIFRNSSKIKGAAVTAGFDLEILYIARKLGLRVSEVPVEWYEYGERREVSPIKDSWDGLRDLIKIRLNSLLGKYRV